MSTRLPRLSCLAMLALLLAAPGAARAQDGATEPVAVVPADGSGWPLEILWRQLTLPGKAWSAGADLNMFKVGDDNFILGGVSLGYGINDRAQVAVGYGFTIDPGEAKGNLSVAFEMVALREHKMEVSPAVSLSYDLLNEGLNPVLIGADFIYRLNDKMGITMPPTHLVVYVEEIAPDVKPIYFQLPIGFMLQATPNVNVQLDTTLALIKIADTESAFFGRDFAPLQATLFYSGSRMWDVGLGVGMDFKVPEGASVGDTLQFLAAFRYYGLPQ